MPGHCSSLRPPLEYCNNMVIQRAFFPITEAFYTGFRGHGLRILEDVSENTIVSEYLGEVITTEECRKRMQSYVETDDFYFASLGGGLMLDAKLMGSSARFANHSCEPTCKRRW